MIDPSQKTGGSTRVPRDSYVMQDERLLTASEVAARFSVDRSWVYAHARELGVVRIGDGPRPRLRFDPAVVTQRQLPLRRLVEAP